MRFFKWQLQLGFDILTTITTPSGSARATEQVSEVETSGGVAAKATKFEITEIETSRRLSRRLPTRSSPRSFPSGRRNARARFDGAPVLAVLIVEFAILGFGQYVISFLQLLELFFRRLISGIQVGMKFARQFAIGLLDLIVSDAPLDPEHLVVVLCLASHGIGPIGPVRPIPSYFGVYSASITSSSAPPPPLPLLELPPAPAPAALA